MRTLVICLASLLRNEISLQGPDTDLLVVISIAEPEGAETFTGSRN
jgi:hypothetical protein